MERLNALLNRKVGGVPIAYIVVLLVVGGGFLVYRFAPVTKDSAADEEGDMEEETQEESSDTTGDDSTGNQPVFLATPSVPTAPISGAVEDTNELWGRRAIEYLLGAGTSLQTATSAITKYLNGEPLSSAEGPLRDKAVKQYGLPPEGIIQTSTLAYSGPATTQGTPPTVHTVKSKSDQTFKVLARIYYGQDTADAINLLNAANTKVTEPFRVGTRITVPRFHRPKYYKANSSAKNQYSIAKKNATTSDKILELNPGMKFPVKVGTRVRVS